MSVALGLLNLEALFLAKISYNASMTVSSCGESMNQATVTAVAAAKYIHISYLSFHL